MSRGRWTRRSTRSGAWCAAHGVDAWYTKARHAVGQRGPGPGRQLGWRRSTPARRSGCGDRYVAAGPRTRSRPGSRSPVFGAGRSCPAPRPIQPAILARGLRRVAARTRRRHPRGHARRGARWRAAGLAGRRSGPGSRRAPAGRAGRPVRIRTTSAAGPGEVLAGSAVVALNAWAAAWPSFGRRLVTWSSYIVLTEPIPDRLAGARLDRRGGTRRRAVHAPLPADDAATAGSPSAVAAAGPASAAASGRPSPTTPSAGVRAAAGLRRLFPSLRGRPHRGRLGRPDRHLRRPPAVGSRACPGRPIHYAHGYSGNGVGPSLVAGRLLAGLAARDIDARSRPALGGPGRSSAVGRGAFPPEPFRYLGARVVPRGDRPARGRSRSGASTWHRSCARSRGCRGGWATTSGPD